MGENTVLVQSENNDNEFDWNEMNIEDYVEEHALIDEKFEDEY